MRPWQLSQVGTILHLNQTFQNVLDFISFPWVKSDVMALWGNVRWTWIWFPMNLFGPPCLP
jgi:hypothetical protein